LTSVKRPSLLIIPLCHAGSRNMALSIRVCHWDFVRGRRVSCIPRYRIGKLARSQPSISVMICSSLPYALISVAVVFDN
jgi:hypothetical protein